MEVRVQDAIGIVRRVECNRNGPVARSRRLRSAGDAERLNQPALLVEYMGLSEGGERINQVLSSPVAL